MSEASLPRPEYPRPQFERSDWLNLNGTWEFAFDDADEGRGAGWWREEHALPAAITVPFPYQSALSGIGDPGLHDVVWYAREFDLPPEYTGCQIWLHFGAVDYLTQLWLNGEPVGENRGGHVPFAFEITAHLRPGRNRVTLRVEDRQDPTQPRGKQAWQEKPAGCFYSRTTGIWQTVWLEPVAPIHIARLRVTPEIDRDTARLELEVAGAGLPGLKLKARALLEGREVAAAVVPVEGERVELDLELARVALWSPDHPFLYDLELTLLRHEMAVDRVSSYFGMREIAVSGTQVLLNRQPLYQCLALDQGYFPGGLLAAPSDEALRRDVELVKELGFNGVRKHQKVEDPRWLYWCDRLGLLVWGEMASALRWSEEAAEAFTEEWARVVDRDYSHPCIVTWVPFNESWGIEGITTSRAQREFVEGVVALTRALDGTRPVVDNDGWEHLPITDLCTIHDYTSSADALRRRYEGFRRGGSLPRTWSPSDRQVYCPGSACPEKPILFTEVGGFMMVPDSLPGSERDWLFQIYGNTESPEQLLEQYRELMKGLGDLDFACGFCYTQLTDIEQEVNGLLTFDRQPKVPVESVAALNREILRRFRERNGLVTDETLIRAQPEGSQCTPVVGTRDERPGERPESSATGPLPRPLPWKERGDGGKASAGPSEARLSASGTPLLPGEGPGEGSFRGGAAPRTDLEVNDTEPPARPVTPPRPGAPDKTSCKTQPQEGQATEAQTTKPPSKPAVPIRPSTTGIPVPVRLFNTP